MKNLKNNKGFSLVELIIVVAIMAILIGVLAPQYLKYVERSRLTSDNDYIDSVRKAVETVAADPTIDLGSATEFTVTISDDADPAFVGGDAFEDGVASIVDTTGRLKAKAYSGKDVVIELKYTNGVPTINVDGLLTGGSGSN